jgi:DNA-binding response OmpR family regulator
MLAEVPIRPNPVTPVVNEETPLDGTRILVIEDEFLIASAVEDALLRAGAREVAIALSPDEGRRALAGVPAFDAAIIDIQLAEITDAGLSLAELALKQQVAIVFLTAYGSDIALPDTFSTVHVLSKPCAPAVLIAEISEAIQRNRNPPAA